MANPLYQKHIISINDLSREDLELVLATAAKLKANPPVSYTHLDVYKRQA